MTTATPTTLPLHVTAADVPDTRSSDEHMGYLTEGLRNATQWPEPVHRLVYQLDPMEDEHPAGLAWERLCDEVADEIAADVADLLTEAIRRRMPWTWEPGKR